ncbi:uncharacterized protein YukE [Amycolatopsis bartoniae]|uniref:Outer membrane channel protein CpnT-like N-terminal domain-containing protein n=1 Tax=Amycolatopsis bartoniae TaxID=941986 RepID=A0A8H9IVW4_9PSEU|nr:WXG100 family type VII secretion target [Amycolatopsis bartoniae]MBB2933402.1 uncharacterized protein YukE [Amycolatopsis bartoniae]TVT06630.1 WXG100 family type VII secretion target [Amycolatopsis bartoniae]GHF59203.1 hypothetical protein GCM10017566_35860 [Amycolatopsis bartoniae]
MTTGFQVEPGALLAHSEGSREASGHLGKLADVLQQARVSDDCFGPIGEFLAFKYFDGLQECQNLAAQAQSFLEQIADNTTLAANMYHGQDQLTAEDLGKYKELADAGGDPASISAVNSAGDSSRKSYLEQNGGYGSSWISTAGDVARASSPPDVVFATINARMEQLQLITSPGQSFVDNGLGFLIGIVLSPLVEFVLEPAIGDPEQMRSTAQGWGGVADWLDGFGDHEKQRADATQQAWQGGGGDAFRQQMSEFADGSKALAEEVRGLQQMLEFAADLFDEFVEICVDIIEQLILGLIVEWLAALAASWITAGGSVAAAEGVTAGETAATGGRLAMKVKELLGKLKPLVEKLEKFLQWLRKGPLKKVVEKMNNMRNGGFLEKRLAEHLDRNPLVKILTKTDAEGIASATGNKFAGALGNGEGALAANLAETGLRMAGMSGTSSVGKAAYRTAKADLPGFAVEQGVKYGYNEAQESQSDEERRETEERGFTLE